MWLLVLTLSAAVGHWTDSVWPIMAPSPYQALHILTVSQAGGTSH